MSRREPQNWSCHGRVKEWRYPCDECEKGLCLACALENVVDGLVSATLAAPPLLHSPRIRQGSAEGVAWPGRAARCGHRACGPDPRRRLSSSSPSSLTFAPILPAPAKITNVTCNPSRRHGVWLIIMAKDRTATGCYRANGCPCFALKLCNVSWLHAQASFHFPLTAEGELGLGSECHRT